MLKNNSVFLKLHDYVFEKTYRRIKNIPPRIIQGPITWPLYRRTEENQKITHFLSSVKDPLGFEENSKNILFLVGPKNVGKSWFLKSTCKNKLIIDNQHITLDGFMNQLKNQIIDYMQSNNMITTDLIIEAAQKYYHDRYLNVYFHKFLKENNIKIEFIPKPIVIEDNQLQDTFEFQFWQEDALNLNINSDTLNFKELFQQVTQNQTQEQYLRMILDFIQQLEYSKLNNPYHITSTTGVIEQIQFLFNLLNLKRLETGFGLIILGIDKLFQYYKHDQEAFNFLDHLILSTFNNTGIRNHFPIILESSNSKFFNRDMMEIMHSDLHNFSHLDIDHIPQDRIPIQVEDIFSSDEIKVIYQRIGGSLSDWHQLTKQAVEIEHFSIKEWLTMKDQKLKNQFEYLCNQVYLNPNVSELLDNHEIDFEFHNILSLIQRFNGIVFTGTFYADSELMHRPMVSALQEEQILYHPKHKSHLHFSQQIYYEYYTQIWNEYKNKLNLFNKMKFIWKSIRKYQHYHLIPRFRGSWHYIQVLEPREKDDDDLKTGYRPYHEYYI